MKKDNNVSTTIGAKPMVVNLELQNEVEEFYTRGFEEDPDKSHAANATDRRQYAVIRMMNAILAPVLAYADADERAKIEEDIARRQDIIRSSLKEAG